MIDTGTLDLSSGGASALFLDIDGTLLDFAARPDKVLVPTGLRQNLAQIAADLDGALALVSGRSVEEIDRLFNPLILPASGVHGSEFRPVPSAPMRVSVPRLPDPIRHGAAAIAAHFPGALFEDKDLAVAVHWRGCPESGPQIEAALADLMNDAPGQLATLRGHCVREIKAASVDKGTAIAEFMRLPPFQGRQPVFVGDDVTDEAGMAAARQLGGRAFSVSRLIGSASDFFADPQAVRSWLSKLARGAPAAAVA